MSEYVVNEGIRSPQVRLVDEHGEQVGVFATKDALRKAREASLDLLQVSDKTNPPVCKIIDFGKFKYEQTRKEKQAARAQRAAQVETKEIQLRPVTDEHDLNVKVRQISKFLTDGNRVKVIVKFHGREITHLDMGFSLINKVFDRIGEHKVEKPPQSGEKNIFAILAPVPVKK